MVKRSKGSSALSKAAEELVDQISSKAQSSMPKEQALLDLLSPATSAQQQSSPPTPVLIDPADPLHKALEKVSLDELLKAFPPKDLPRNQ